MNIVDISGYMAMVFVTFSFLCKNMKTLRLINTVGCLAFIVHGAFMDKPSYSIIITNALIVLFNLYSLYQTSREENKQAA